MASASVEGARPPLMLLKNAMHKEVCIETSNGDSYVGLLKGVDSWMNVTMRRTIRTANNAESYWSAQEVLIRGASITNITVPDTILDVNHFQSTARGGAGGRGRGSGRGGRGGGASAGRGRGFGGGDRGRGRGAANRGRDKMASGGKRNRDE